MIARQTIFERAHELIWNALDASADFREAFRNGRRYRWTRGEDDAPPADGATDVDCPAISISVGELPSKWRSDSAQEFKASYPATIWVSSPNPFVAIRLYALVWEALMARTDSQLGYPERISRFEITAPTLKAIGSKRSGAAWKLEFRIEVTFIVNARSAGALFHSPATG